VLRYSSTLFLTSAVEGGEGSASRPSCQNKFVELVDLVGFIIKKFVTMHGHTNVKLISLLSCSIVPNTGSYPRTSEKISGQAFIPRCST